MHLLTDLSKNLFVNNAGKQTNRQNKTLKHATFLWDKEQYRDQKVGFERRECKEIVSIISIRIGCWGWQGIHCCTCENAECSFYFTKFEFDWDLELSGAVRGNYLHDDTLQPWTAGLSGPPTPPLTNHSGHLRTEEQITKISNGIIILDKLKMLPSPLEQPENRTIHWLNFNGTIKEQLIPQHGVPSVGNYRVRNAPSLRWPDSCKVPWWLAMFVKLVIVYTQIYPISQK